MATFLCAWELGGGLGHLMRMKPIAEQLKMLGHRVIFVVQKLPRSHFLIEAGFECIQAPIFLPSPGPPPNSMAQILAKRGYSNFQTLFRSVSEWLTIYREINPDLILVDYSPTAILASRNGRTPVVAVGNGFVFPPRNRWACNLRPWLPDTGLREIEEVVICNVNDVAKKLNLAGVNRVSELFYGEYNFIYELPETDVYQRSGNNYVIKKSEPNGFFSPIWEGGHKNKIAGYLKANFKENKRILSALSKLDAEVILTIPGYDASDVVLASNITIYTQPIDLTELISGADVVLYHSGGTIKDVVLHGKVSLLAPTQLEQFYYARRMEKNGFGEIIDFEKQDLTYQIREVINNNSYKRNVALVSDKYQKLGGAVTSQEMAMKLISLVQSKTS